MPRMRRFVWLALVVGFASTHPTQATADELTANALVVKPKIRYPREAREKRIEGSGVVEIRVDPKTGAVREARMFKSTGSSILDNAAVTALQKARFKPGTVVRVRIPIRFSLSSRYW